ncbi:hypothetical protein Aduo_005785 [Ancylostoma duodenale]
MDPPSRKSRRSSILKIRQTEVVLESTAVEDDQKQVLKRRVSFHNVKTVQNFEKDNLNLLDGSPFREKIQETMSSDGILTPGRTQLTLSTPSTANSNSNAENANFTEDTMAAFEGGPRQRLSYDEVTSYSIADMSMGDTTQTTVTDDTEAVPIETQALQLDDHSAVDMCISETISAGDDEVPHNVKSNSTQYSSVDMSFSTTMNYSSRSSDDTLAALDVTCGNRKIAANQNRGADLNASSKLSRGLPKCDLTMDETMVAMSTKPGQSVSMFLTPAHTSHNKSSVSTYNDDTALAFEDVITARTRDSGQEDEMKLSTTISDSTFSGDTMAVFETVERDKESAASGSSDMDITSVATSTSVLENHSPPSCAVAVSHEEEPGNATFVVEHRSPIQPLANLSVGSPHFEQAANETVTLVGSEKSCHIEAESSSVATGDDYGLTFTQAAGDYEEASGEQSVCKDTSIVISRISDSSDVKAPNLSFSHTILLKSHLESPGVVDRKRQRRFNDKRSETMEGEELEEQRRADVSLYPANPAAVDAVFEEKGACGTVLLSNDDGNAGESIEVVQDHTAITNADTTAICNEKMDITQLSDEGVAVPYNDDTNKTALMCDTLRTLAEQVEDLEEGADQRTATANCSILSTLNESNIARRDISVLQPGSRFRLSTSSRDDTVLSTKSLRDETISISHRMMFDSHALQVMYANPADDQPEGNLVREQIVDELTKKLLDMQQRSEGDFGVLFPKLRARDAAKALAVRNMTPRALSVDEADLLQSGRLRAEIEWANIRTEVAKQAVSALEQCLAEDDPCLKELCEDVQLCERLDELEAEVRDLEKSLSGVPSAHEVAEILRAYEQAVKDEEDLDARILDKQIEVITPYAIYSGIIRFLFSHIESTDPAISFFVKFFFFVNRHTLDLVEPTQFRNNAQHTNGLPIGANEGCFYYLGVRLTSIL